jgi:hypothetical protein
MDAMRASWSPPDAQPRHAVRRRRTRQAKASAAGVKSGSDGGQNRRHGQMGSRAGYSRGVCSRPFTPASCGGLELCVRRGSTERADALVSARHAVRSLSDRPAAAGGRSHASTWTLAASDRGTACLGCPGCECAHHRWARWVFGGAAVTRAGPGRKRPAARRAPSRMRRGCWRSQCFASPRTAHVSRRRMGAARPRLDERDSRER